MPKPRFRYAIIGTGRPHRSEGATGFGMAHTHYPHFLATGKVDLVAIADIRTDNARLFLDTYECAAKHYTDYHEMLEREWPDVVSICTWPHLHAEMAVAAAEAGVKAIHCEKPMAITWADCKRMKEAADRSGSRLTFNHQRRHIKLFQEARRLAQSGAVGDLALIEAQIGDLFDWGTHWLDMMFFYNAETPAEWVIGQIDSRRDRRAFGAFMETQGLCHFKWRNGVRGIAITGHEAQIGCTHRLIGTEGVMEVTSERSLRILGNGNQQWQIVEVPQGEENEHLLTARDILRQLEEPGYRSILSADYAIQHTEVLFATYLSSKERARVDLPLAYEGNALLDMLAAGEIGGSRWES